jgi:addiction module HigA family antidote
MTLPKKRKPTHPGEMLLEEFLNPMGLTQKQLAEHLGWTTAKVSEIVNGRRGLTAESALALADAFGMEAEFWLNLQLNLDLWNASQGHVHIKKIAA